MAAKFVVKKGTTGKFRFSLLSANGQVVASSQAYNTKAACINGLRSVQRNAGDAEVEDQTTKEWAAAEAARKAAASAKKAVRKSTKAVRKVAKAPVKRAAKAAAK